MAVRYIYSGRGNRDNINGVNANFQYLFEEVAGVYAFIAKVDKRSNEVLGVATSVLSEARRVATEVDNVQQQINNVVLSEGNSDAEVLQARGDYSVLNERLDDMDAESIRLATQPNYVDKLLGINRYDEIQVKKSNETTFSVSNFNKVAGRHVTNVFTKNANDDYIVLSESFVGGITTSELAKDYRNYTKISGTIDTTYATHYATEVGTKISVTLSGSELYIRRYGDNKGGIWEFVIDGDINNKILVSTFKATAGTDDYKIIGGLEDKTHKIEGTFMGNDPSNAPVGGISRGWLPFNETVDTSKTFFSRFVNVNMAREKTINVANSNKDFAWLIRKSGSTGDYFFVPEHNAIGTAFKINEPQFLLDGKPITIFDKTVGVSQIGKSFVVNQSIYGRDPVTKENLVRVDTVHEVSLDSSVRTLGKIRALVNIEIKDAYFLMLPVMNDSARRLKSARHNYYAAIKNDGTQTKLAYEKDDTSSYIFTSDVNPNLFSALVINDVLHTLRSGLDEKFAEGSTTWIEHRADSTLQKLYNSVYRYGTMTGGEEITYDGVYLSGEITNIHNLV